jgi:hypothetical protein
MHIGIEGNVQPSRVVLVRSVSLFRLNISSIKINSLTFIAYGSYFHLVADLPE